MGYNFGRHSSLNSSGFNTSRTATATRFRVQGLGSRVQGLGLRAEGKCQALLSLVPRL